MARRRSAKLPKLTPGDIVPHTGKFRLSAGVRIKPVRRYKPSTRRRMPSFGKARRTSTRRRMPSRSY
jgi:hypothetical protein